MNAIVVSLAIVLIAAHPAQDVQKNWASLHPALQMDGAKAVVFFDRGYADADHIKDLRKIGRPYVKGFRDRNESVIVVRGMAFAAYEDGFNAKKKYLDDIAVAKMRDDYSRYPAGDTLLVEGRLSTLLSNDSCVTTDANGRSTIGGVRLALKVGNRIYQPVRQPGDLLADNRTESFTSSVPDITTVFDHDYNVVGTVTSRHKESASYDLVEADLSASFSLFDPDGKARITANDKEFTIALIYGDKVREVKFKVDDLGLVNGKKVNDK